MKSKSTRNQKILAAYKTGEMIASIAGRFKLSWPRTQRIIRQELARQGQKEGAGV
jgi:hypothetical protein